MILNLLDFAAAYALRMAAHRFFPKHTSELLEAISRLESQHVSVPNDSDLDVLIRALVVAEDRRFFSHFGVDSKGLARVVFLFLTRMRIQGASTITQQLVRVLSNDYRYSVQRKFKEMCLACVVDRTISKRTQAALYVRVAYFGWRMNGVTQAWHRLHLATPLSSSSAASLIARLRYPEPRETTPIYLEKLNRRSSYIATLMNRQD